MSAIRDSATTSDTAGHASPDTLGTSGSAQQVSESRGRPWDWLPVAVLPSALALWFASDPIAERLAARLPDAVTVRSGGTVYPGFAEGFGFTLRGVAASMLIASFVWPLARSARLRDVLRRVEVPRWAPVAVLSLGAFAVYAWLAHPPNIYPSNARIHWVDIFFERTDDWFYSLVKGPHALFYERPFLLKGLLGAISTSVVFLIGLRLLRTRALAAVMALSFLLAERMLLFANAAEDVTLNVTALVLAGLAFVTRRPILFGIALFVTILGRPEFGVLGIAFVVAEILVGTRREGDHGRSRPAQIIFGNPMLWKGVATFFVLFVTWHAVLAAFDVSWLFKDGGFTERQTLSEAPIPVDGFVISALSGATVSHFLWLTSPFLLGGNLLALLSWKRLPPAARQFFVFSWAFILLNLAFHEVEPVLYFNIRYISYTWPFLLISGWLGLRYGPRRLFEAVPVAVIATLLAVSTISPRLTALETRRNVADREMTGLYYDRGELRRITADRKVATTFRAFGKRNYIAYVLKRDVRTIPVRDAAEMKPGWLVFTSVPEDFRGGRVYYVGDRVFLESKRVHLVEVPSAEGAPEAVGSG